MNEFADRPCGWNLQAPVELRRQALGGVSAWRNYSTSQFVGGLLHTVYVCTMTALAALVRRMSFPRSSGRDYAGGAVPHTCRPAM